MLPDSDSEIEGGAVMMDEKRLEQEYRRLKCQQTPDLWSRIEGNLQEHPERNPEENIPKALQEAGPKTVRFRRKRVYGMATAAAAMLVLVVAMPKMMEGRWKKSDSVNQMAPPMAGAAGAVTMEAEKAAGGEEMAAEKAAGGEEMAAEKAASGAEKETAVRKAADTAEAETAAEESAGGASPESGAIMGAGLPAGQEPSIENREKRVLPEGILACDQLQLASYQPVALPGNAVTVAEDSQYFSEDILRDAELLCGARVTGVSLEQDATGKAVKVVYEMAMEQVYYAEDYVTGMETVTVKSPIIKTDGDEMYILYQLQPGGTYLLPLYKPGQDWELLYPFAPQIQVTGDGAYLFHTGYTSLMTEDTSLVIGRPEGDNDYFYDRMVLRRDENFLSDLLKLVGQE